MNKHEVLFNSGKQLLKHTKCLKRFVVMNLYLVCMRENGLKNIEMDVRTLKLIDSGWPQLIEIRKQKYVNLWPNVVRDG